jgi:DNA-binding IclR family transcriptional regulator
VKTVLSAEIFTCAKTLNNAEIAQEVGASKQTIGRYRQELEKLGLLKIEGDIWTVGYTLKSQRNT